MDIRFERSIAIRLINSPNGIVFVGITVPYTKAAGETAIKGLVQV